MVYEIMKHNYEHKVRESGVSTLLHPVDGGYALRYHQTDVVTAYPDGSVKLDSGGWRTPTTKERINRYLPTGYVLYQKNNKWWISTPHGEIAFKDGMVINPAQEAAA